MTQLKLSFGRPAGTFLAVLGPDGAGKTTFISALHDRLKELSYFDIDKVHVLHFRPHVLPNINRLLTGQIEVIADFNNPHTAPPAGKLSSLLRIIYYSLDYVIGYWLILRQRMAAGHTIIFDRYAYDFIVDPRRSRLSNTQLASKLLRWIIPKPDLVFILDAPADLIYERKQELAPIEIERQLSAYRALIAGMPMKFVRIDASESPKLMVDAAIREIETRLHRRA